jgi:hypothetical protein
MKLLLFDERYSCASKFMKENLASVAAAVDADGSPSSMRQSCSSLEEVDSYVNSQFGAQKFLVGVWQYNDEVTLLLEEGDEELFPEGALTVSPLRWRGIRLGGRPVLFHETGIVSAMSAVETGIPCLNISTALTNCTLVPDELIDSSLNSLSAALHGACIVKLD